MTIAIDILNEETITLTEAAKLFPPSRRVKDDNGTFTVRPVSFGCIFRWIAEGVKIPNGSVVRLEAVRVGGRWRTSKSAIRRFVERQTPRFDDAPAMPRTMSARQRAAELAGRELAKSGI
jgi:hypothetical protein